MRRTALARVARGGSRTLCQTAAFCGALACGGGAFGVGSDPQDAGLDSGGPSAEERGTQGPDASVGADVQNAADGDLALEADAEASADESDAPPLHCAGEFTCSPPVPPGWTGPLELSLDGSSASACTRHFAGPMFRGSTGLTGAPATCDCQCEAPTGVQCSAPLLSYFGSQSQCSPKAPCACPPTQRCDEVKVAPGACTPVDVTQNCGAIVTIQFAPSTPSGGSCAAIATAAIAPSAWTVEASACMSSLGQAQSDCSGDAICAPIAAAPFAAPLCIAQSGDVPCPASGYVEKHLFYAALTDARGCAPCTCAPPAGMSCSAGFALSVAGTGCGSGTVDYTSPGACQPAPTQSDVELAVTATSGACAASAGAAVGDVTPADPTTFCCL